MFLKSRFTHSLSAFGLRTISHSVSYETYICTFQPCEDGELWKARCVAYPYDLLYRGGDREVRACEQSELP